MSDKKILKDVSDDQLEAFVQVVVLVAYADGDLSKAEEEVLIGRVKELAGDRVTLDHLQELMVELPPLSRGSKNWRAERIQSLKKNLEDQALRNEAFALAVDVARSENGIGLREGRMLVNVVTELGVDGEFARQVLNDRESQG